MMMTTHSQSTLFKLRGAERRKPLETTMTTMMTMMTTTMMTTRSLRGANVVLQVAEKLQSVRGVD